MHLLFVIAAQCSIEAQAYGANNFAEVKYAYVKLNGVAVWQASFLGEHPNAYGAHMFVVDPFTCTLLESRNDNTYGDAVAAGRLRAYIESLGDGTVLVGVSTDEASLYLDAAEATLSALGADVSDVGWRGAWAFVTEIGDPSKTVFDKELTEEAARARQPIVTTSLPGTVRSITEAAQLCLHHT